MSLQARRRDRWQGRAVRDPQLRLPLRVAALTRADALSSRPLTYDDLAQLRHWLWQPHVDAWWHEAWDEERTLAKYGPRIDGVEPVYVRILVLGARPIGWMQWYRWRDFPAHAAMIGARDDEAGIDLAIGEADMLGRGLGARAIRGLLDDVIFADAALAACVVDPDASNARSVRAFEKAGFVTMREAVQLADEPFVRRVMRCARTHF